MSTTSGPPPSSYNYPGASSSSSTTMSSKPASASTSKRHSMPLSPSSGPRPLHLLDLAGSIPTSSPASVLSPSRPSTSSSPLYAPSPLLPPSTSSEPQSRVSTPRSAKRQSAISYFSPDHVSAREKETLVKRSSTPLTSTFGGSISAEGTGASASATIRTNAGDSKPAQVVPAEEQRERPLTTAEKHAELLHFIAQKEAKCLELRSQLAMHEEELLQLKRKWERIINRGLERENSTTLSSAAYPTNPKDIPAALMSLTTNPTLTLEGIREGVQGMSRLLAAGLSISTPPDQLHRPPKLTVPSNGRSQSSSPIPPSPLSLSSTLPSGRNLARHATRESESSNTTWTTRSSLDVNRLSQCSSATSLEDDDESAAKRDQNGATVLQHSNNGSLQSSPQELLLMDTGATPTMSPNPKFLEQKARRRKRLEDKKSEEALASDSLSDPWDQKNGDGGGDEAWDMWGEAGDKRSGKEKAVEGQRHDRASATTTSRQDSGTFWLMDPPPKMADKKLAEDMDKKASGSLGGLSSPQMSSWMGAMGKKLGGELQKSGNVLTNTQKRASLMLSDMSQSFVSALTSPPIDTPSSSMSLTASPTVSSISTSPSSPLPPMSDPMYGLVSPVPSTKAKKRQSLTLGASLSRSASLSRNAIKGNGAGAKSLLDDDDDGFGPMVGGGSVLQPDNVKPVAKIASAKKVQDDEDEWNW